MIDIKMRDFGFYTEQGPRTCVRLGTFDDFPDDIGEICEIIQSILIHPSMLAAYGLNLPESRIADRRLKTIQGSIDRAILFDRKSLLEHRAPQERVVSICRHFAMFLVSVLREKGIPARSRCGFATYFENGWFEDHWICEYWKKDEQRWARVDAEIDKMHKKVLHLDATFIDFNDLPPEAFFPAGILWKLHREGLISGRLCGYSQEEGECGAWYIRGGNMLRDFFSLNKVEYTYQEINRLMSKDYQPTEAEYAILDTIADLTIKVDERFDEFTEFHKENQTLNPK